MGRYRVKKRYIGAWSYILLGTLYMLPQIGWRIALIHAIHAKNENIKHFARARFVFMFLEVLIAVIYLLVCSYQKHFPV